MAMNAIPDGVASHLRMAATILGWTIAGICLVFAVVWLALQFRPTFKDRFDACMAVASEAGLLETERDRAGLICLHNATRPPPAPDGQVLPIPGIPQGMF